MPTLFVHVFLTKSTYSDEEASLANPFPEEILWIKRQSETDETRGLDIQRAVVASSDGSRLDMAACVKRPPLGEMESTFIQYMILLAKSAEAAKRL